MSEIWFRILSKNMKLLIYDLKGMHSVVSAYNLYNLQYLILSKINCAAINVIL
jgi:hypothetical protein